MKYIILSNQNIGSTICVSKDLPDYFKFPNIYIYMCVILRMIQYFSFLSVNIPKQSKVCFIPCQLKLEWCIVGYFFSGDKNLGH